MTWGTWSYWRHWSLELLELLELLKLLGLLELWDLLAMEVILTLLDAGANKCTSAAIGSSDLQFMRS